MNMWMYTDTSMKSCICVDAYKNCLCTIPCILPPLLTPKIEFLIGHSKAASLPEYLDIVAAKVKLSQGRQSLQGLQMLQVIALSAKENKVLELLHALREAGKFVMGYVETLQATQGLDPSEIFYVVAVQQELLQLRQTHKSLR